MRVLKVARGLIVPDPRPNPPYESLPNIQAVNLDFDAMHQTLTRNNIAYTARERAAPVGQQRLWQLTVDLFLRIKEYAGASSLLLSWGAVVPFFPVLRSMYESLTTLEYLSTHPSAEFEAQVAYAHGYFSALWKWEKRGSPATERARLDGLKAAMDGLNLDAAAIAEAKERAGSFDWTGKSRAKVIESVTGSVDEYETFYSPLAQVSHPHTVIGGLMQNLPPSQIDMFARFPRVYLRAAWGYLRQRIPVPLPDARLDDPSTKPPLVTTSPTPPA
jgi:hypothetical protein